MKTTFKSFIIIGLCGAFAFLSQSCNKVLPGVDVSWSGVDVTQNVPIVPDTVTHLAMGTSTFKYNIDSMIKAKAGTSFSASMISKVTLKSCKLTINNANPTNNFANFQLCDLFFNSSINPVTAHTATIANNPDMNSDTLDVPVDNTIDLKSYFYSSSSSGPVTITYVFGGKLRRPTTMVLNVTAHVEYDLKIQP